MRRWTALLRWKLLQHGVSQSCVRDLAGADFDVSTSKKCGYGVHHLVVQSLVNGR